MLYADVHKLLSKQKIAHNKTINGCFLIMKRIANKVKIENSALICCIIQDIKDEIYRKVSLYGCQDLYDFK